MPLPVTQIDALQSALEELDRNLVRHDAWADRLHATLVCGSPPAPDILAEDAHCKCQLGVWLATRAALFFEEPSLVEEIDTLHLKMHRQARRLAQLRMAGEAVSEKDYQAFVSLRNELRNAIKTMILRVNASLAGADSLTGAFNRNQMRERLERLISRTEADRVTGFLLMLDLDHFKTVNDRFGHQTGDLVLAGIGKCVRAHIRDGDLFFRYGGEEFLLAVSQSDIDAVLALSERLRVAIAAIGFSSENGEEFHVTTSIGVAPLRPRMSVDEAIFSADKALYDAKAAGRNQVVLAQRKAA